jgi:hypothetical protein
MGIRARLLALGVILAAIALPAAAAVAAAPCDDLDSSACLYPWPNDLFTKADPTTDTGRRLDLPLTGMPSNIAGKPIDPTEMNRNDGFSPGSLIATRVPGLDTQAAFAATGLVPITDPSRSFDSNQPAVVIDAATGKRQLIWSELEYPDSLGKDPSVETLVIHPERNFQEGHRYIVALRDLRRADGSLIPASDAFKAYRDGTATDARAAHFESIFSSLRKAHIARENLYLAWDFTVASARNLSERMLHIRDDAFAQLGDTNLADVKVQGTAPIAEVYPDLPDDQVNSAPSAPEVGNVPQQIDGITDFKPCGSDGCQAGESDKLRRIVRGRVLVPCYLSTPGCAEGGSFVYDSAGLPQQIPGNMMAASFTCIIPRWIETNGPARPSLYGHGLLGTGSQVTGGPIQDLANEQGFVLCGTDWSGMSQEDLPNVATILADLSRFNTLADRTQQGMLNFLYLGRALIHPDGLASDPAFNPDGKRAIDTSRLYYDGGSQGGIMGGSLTAVAPDFTRAALGVPGMNYSTLLQRSVDFDTYAQIMYNAYPDELQRPLILSLIQLLWDRGEADGYAWHMTSRPYANTPPHEVILSMAHGDHQVTNWATLVEARTVPDVRVRTPIVEPFRQQGDEFFGIPPITSFPAKGSELLVSDVGPLRTLADGSTKGTPPPPTDNVPNREGVDPHGPDASEQVWARAQIGAFLRPDAQSRIIAVCDDHPCYLDGWAGP